MPDQLIKRPLWVTMTACGFAAVLFSSIAIGSIAWYRQSVSSHEAFTREAYSDAALIDTDMVAQQKAASALAIALAGEPDMASLITENSRGRLLSRFLSSMQGIKETGGLQNITFVDAKGVAVARIHTPDKFGDDITSRRKTVVAALATGRLVAGIEPGKSAVSMFASAPVVKDGKTVGVVDVGTGLTDAYFKPLAARINGDVTIYVLSDGKFAVQAATGTKPFLSDASLQSVFSGAPFQQEVGRDGKSFVVSATAFKNFSGETIGVLEIASDVTSVAKGAQQALWTTIAGAFIAALVSLIGFYAFARSLARIIARVTETMSALASGDLEATVDGDTRNDEVGAMARAVQVFKTNALHTKSLEAEAAQQRDQTDEEHRKAAEQDSFRTQAMTKATRGLGNGLKQLASGDLSIQLTERFADDFEDLRTDFNLAVEQLRSTLSAVAEATRSIDHGSREISHSADDLSRRTEQQAAP